MFSVKHSPELMTDIHKNGLLFSWAFMSWNDDALCCPCRTAVWGFIISQRTTSCRQHARSLSDFLFFFLNLPTTLKKFVYHHWCASHNLENCCYVRELNFAAYAQLWREDWLCCKQETANYPYCSCRNNPPLNVYHLHLFKYWKVSVNFALKWSLDETLYLRQLV